MAFVQSIIDFFQNLFMASSPDVKKRQSMRKIEAELKTMSPILYKNGLILGNFAEGMRVLYFATKNIGDLLSETVCSEEHNRSHYYEEQLLITGFDDEAQEILADMEYSRRKERAREAGQSVSRFFDSEHRQLEKVVKELNTPDFMKIEAVINKLKQLNDLCRFDYMTVLRLFDEDFTPMENYQPSFDGIPIEMLETTLRDFYYVAADFEVTTSLANAVKALLELYSGGNAGDNQKRSLVENLRKIQGVCKHVFTKEMLVRLIRLAKKDSEYKPEQASYRGNQRQAYADYLEERFRVDESRLKVEIQDETILNNVHELFGSRSLELIKGYNNELSNQLKQSTPCSFNYVMPVQVLKTFAMDYYEAHAKPLLNDIVVEGFFNNSAYKSEFSSEVFACNDALERINRFEQLFARNGTFDEMLISGLITDSHKNSSFITQLKDVIERANKAAKELLQVEANNFFQLSKKLADIVLESKKPSSDVITNLHVLMVSSRNREHAENVERQANNWKIFLEIMKNYVIIGNIEKK